jgi:hypothetical protein
MTRASPDAAPAIRKRKADDFEWETSKENVMPLKRGRNVADLNKALRAHDSFQTKLQLEDELKAKEDAIAAYTGEDPLAGWLEYVRWLEVKMPEDTRKKFKVLEKCTRELKDDPRYRNDMRYIRLWIQYVSERRMQDRRCDVIDWCVCRRIWCPTRRTFSSTCTRTRSESASHSSTLAGPTCWRRWRTTRKHTRFI